LEILVVVYLLSLLLGAIYNRIAVVRHKSATP
jgi:hypothetical protein